MRDTFCVASVRGLSASNVGPACLSLLVLVVVVAVWPLRDAQLPEVVGTLALWCSAVLVLNVLTGALLFVRFVNDGDLRLLVLAAAYLSSAMAVVIMMFSLPGVIGVRSLFADAGAATGWLWLTRHIGPPILIATALVPWPRWLNAHAVVARGRRSKGAVAVLAAVGLGPGLLAVVLVGVPQWLPRVYDTEAFEFTRAAQVAVVAVNVSTVAVAFVGLRRRGDLTGIERWSLVAVVAWLGDVVLTLTHAQLFSVGFYGARLLGIVSALVVITAMSVEFSRTHKQLSRGHRDLTVRMDDLLLATQQRDHLVAVFGHELRTPLTGLSGYLELLTEARLSDADTDRLLRRALALSKRVNLLAEDLLASRTSEHATLVLIPEDLDVGHQLTECVANFPGLDVAVECPPGLVVSVDALRLQQVLTNLVRNAQKHGREPVTLSAGPAAGSVVRIQVADAGPGVPAALVPDLFRPYTRASSVRSAGSGLGLSVVADLVELHHGSVHYDTASQSFVVDLPARDPREHADTSSQVASA